MEPCRQDRGPTLGELVEDAWASVMLAAGLGIMLAGVLLAVVLVAGILDWAGLV